MGQSLTKANMGFQESQLVSWSEDLPKCHSFEYKSHFLLLCLPVAQQENMRTREFLSFKIHFTEWQVKYFHTVKVYHYFHIKAYLLKRIYCTWWKCFGSMNSSFVFGLPQQRHSAGNKVVGLSLWQFFGKLYSWDIFALSVTVQWF